MKKKIALWLTILSIVVGLGKYTPAHAAAVDCGAGAASTVPNFVAGGNTEWRGMFGWQPKANDCVMRLHVEILSGGLGLHAIKWNGDVSSCTLADNKEAVDCTATTAFSLSGFFDSPGVEHSTIQITETSSVFNRTFDVFEALHVFMPNIRK